MLGPEDMMRECMRDLIREGWTAQDISEVAAEEAMFVRKQDKKEFPCCWGLRPVHSYGCQNAEVHNFTGHGSDGEGQ